MLKRRMLELQVGRNMYVIDIRAKVQVNRRTGDRRKIRRRKIDMAADDRTEMAVVKRIESWPATRLPEGHTCGNELWIPLCDSEEDLEKILYTAVMNFEAGFAMS